MGRLNRRQLRCYFEEVIAPNDEIIVVYSGIWTFGHQFDVALRDVPITIIEAILEAIGSSRTLVLPSYTYSYAGLRVYSPETAIPETGVLPQVFWRNFPCVRTPSALNSFLAIGPKARELSQIYGPTLWGAGSVKAYFEQTHARMVTLGIPWKDSLGFLHRIEEAAHVPYRYFKTFHGQWIENNLSKPWKETMYVRSINVMPVYAWFRVDEILRQRSKIRASNNSMFIESADAADIVSVGLEILAEDPYGLLSNPKAVRDWVINGKEKEIDTLRTVEPKALDWFDKERFM